MNGTARRVVVVTPVHNRREITLQCLRSLRCIDRTGLDVRAVVVDDGSTDGTEDAVRREFPDVEVIRGDGTLWYTAGTNRGIAAALAHRPDYILAINDDTVFDPSFLRRMVRCAEENPRSVVGALLLLWDDPERVFQVGAVWDTWYGGWRHRHDLTAKNVPDRPWDVEIIVGNCVLYPADAIRRVGLMNEKALPHYGDAEYTPRMRKAGWRLLIEPSARVFCQPNSVPPPFRNVPAARLAKMLLVDRRQPVNLVTQFRERWASAPDRLRGVAAFLVYLCRVALRRAGILKAWPRGPARVAELPAAAGSTGGGKR